jgi:hypothetical protein
MNTKFFINIDLLISNERKNGIEVGQPLNLRRVHMDIYCLKVHFKILITIKRKYAHVSQNILYLHTS